jgi:hypothetical protein
MAVTPVSWFDTNSETPPHRPRADGKGFFWTGSISCLSRRGFGNPNVAQKTIVKRNSFRLERDDRVPFAVLVDDTKGEI